MGTGEIFLVMSRSLCLRMPISHSVEIFVQGTNSHTSCPHATSSLTSEGKNPPVFCLSGLIIIVRYSVHHVKYKIIVTFHIQIFNALLFQLTLHPCASSDLVFLSLEPLQDSAGQINSSRGSGPSILFLPIPLPKLFSVWQRIVENGPLLTLTSHYLHYDTFICYNPFK